jgi:hypothetical protein
MKCLLLAAVALAGCATGSPSVWKRPDTHAITFDKVAVVAAVDDAVARRAAEEQLVQALRPITAVTERRLNMTQNVPPDVLKTQLLADGCDGAVVLSVQTVPEGIRAIPRGFQFSKWGTWPITDARVVKPGYDVVATLTVYDIATGDVMLGVATPPSNPIDLADRVAEAAAVLRSQLNAAPATYSNR